MTFESFRFYGECPTATALTIYNNHLDRSAKLEHCIYDGATSTNKDSEWAVGLKGKGLIPYYLITRSIMRFFTL